MTREARHDRVPGVIDIDVHRLNERLGQEVAITDWLEIGQRRIDQFADATGDHQWIHTDPARAKEQSPFRSTIAHGFLTLSLVSTLAQMAMSFGTLQMAINYGVNRVRFIAPVPSGARVRGRFTVAAVETMEGAVQVTWRVTVEREGGDKPCALVEWIVRYYPAA
jgi:acyl dehydratase